MEDFPFFKELFKDSEILEFIPQKPFSKEELLGRFNRNLDWELQDLRELKVDCGIFTKEEEELIGLALFLTFFIMAPVFEEINDTAIQPYIAEEMTARQAFDTAQLPIAICLGCIGFTKGRGLSHGCILCISYRLRKGELRR